MSCWLAGAAPAAVANMLVTGVSLSQQQVAESTSANQGRPGSDVTIEVSDVAVDLDATLLSTLAIVVAITTSGRPMAPPGRCYPVAPRSAAAAAGVRVLRTSLTASCLALPCKVSGVQNPLHCTAKAGQPQVAKCAWQASSATTSFRLAMLSVCLTPSDSSKRPHAASLGFWASGVAYAATLETRAAVCVLF